MKTGLHELKAYFYQAGGPTYFQIWYNGPDTGNKDVFVKASNVAPKPTTPTAPAVGFKGRYWWGKSPLRLWIDNAKIWDRGCRGHPGLGQQK